MHGAKPLTPLQFYDAVRLGAIPLVLYVGERRKSRLLNDIFEQFKVKETIEREVRLASTSRADTERDLNASKDELTKLTRDIENNIPVQARAAFYNAAIPEIELQILALSKQRDVMKDALVKTGATPLRASRLQPILRTEINSTVMARRRLDERQTVLSILTGFTASIAMLNILDPLRPVLIFAE